MSWFWWEPIKKETKNSKKWIIKKMYYSYVIILHKYIYFVGYHKVFFYYNYIISGKSSKIDQIPYILFHHILYSYSQFDINKWKKKSVRKKTCQITNLNIWPELEKRLTQNIFLKLFANPNLSYFTNSNSKLF